MAKQRDATPTVAVEPVPQGRFFRPLDWAAFWTATLVTFAVYFYTMAPTVTLEDSGELATAGAFLGVRAPFPALGQPFTSTPSGYAFPGAGAPLLALVAVLAMGVMAFIAFPPTPPKDAGSAAGRPLAEIMRQPVFMVATVGAALGYGVMNLLMAATPLAMQVCGFDFGAAAQVLQWHVIGMFAPGFFTGHLIKRFGTLPIMGVGVLLNGVCVAIALSGVDLQQFLVALFALGVGWNFLFTGSTTLALTAYRPEEKDRAQAAINFCVFAAMAFTSFASGALVTTQGWRWLNLGSLPVLVVIAGALAWLGFTSRTRGAARHG